MEKNYHLPSCCVIQEKSKVNQVRDGIDCGAPFFSSKENENERRQRWAKEIRKKKRFS